MPRAYNVSFKNVAISAAQDLVSILGTTGKIVILRRVWLYMNDVTLQTAQGMRLNVKYSQATFSYGSGGSTPTPTPIDPGDAAATFAPHVNDTTPGTVATGSFVDLTPVGGFNYGGYDYTWPRGEEPMCSLNEGLIFEMLSAPTGTAHFSGGMTVLEMGK